MELRRQTRTEKLHSRLRRLAIVFQSEVRMTIVTELFMREMSPHQFYEQFGGGSEKAVERHFHVLTKHRWLRIVRTVPGAGGRGTRTMYRATELAVFDKETWAALPYPVRVTFSNLTYKQLSDRIREALVAGTFDSRPDRHFSWTPTLLDKLGWERMVRAVDELFLSLSAEQEDAKLRLFQSGETSFLATLGLAMFESPNAPETGGLRSAWLGTHMEPTASASYLLSRVFDDPICLRLVSEATLQEISAPMFAAEWEGVSLQTIRRRCKALVSLGWLEPTERRRGARPGEAAQFYRASRPAVFDTATWTKVPRSARNKYSWTTFRQLSEQIEAASGAGTLDRRSDRHLTWSSMTLDELGWEKLRRAIDEQFELIQKERERAKDRMAYSRESPSRVIVALALFESPKRRPG